MSFTIGADPELICHRNGQFVPAHNFFKSNSSFGLDGCESTAEIRPGFSESPIDLTAKIYTILDYGHDKAPDLEFIAGHYVDDYSIGGHTHFSIDPIPEVIDGLDIVLGSLSNCIDDKMQRQKRERSGYGKKGAYRRKSYGFEYRTPGSFLLSPSVTLVHLHFQSLLLLEFLKIKLISMNLRTDSIAVHFLNHSSIHFIQFQRIAEKDLKNLIHFLVKD